MRRWQERHISIVTSDCSSTIPSISSFDWTGKRNSSQNSVCYQQQTVCQHMIPVSQTFGDTSVSQENTPKKAEPMCDSLMRENSILNIQYIQLSKKEMLQDFNYVTWLCSKLTDQPVNLCFCFPGCAAFCVWVKTVLLTLFRFLLNWRRLLRQVLLLLSLQCIPRCLFLFFWWGDFLTRGHRSTSHNFWCQTDILLFRVWVVVRLQRKNKKLWVTKRWKRESCCKWWIICKQWIRILCVYYFHCQLICQTLSDWNRLIT